MDLSVNQTPIHPTAIIHPSAQIGTNVVIGPYSVIREHTIIGDNSVIHSHVVILPHTHIGKNCQIHSFSTLGGDPQDLKFNGEETYVIIGDNNVLREYVTVNRGTKSGDKTQIGDNNFLMAYCHVAHNCVIKSNVVMANAATLAGHVVIEDYAILGGLSGIHQFVRVGAYCLIGGCSKVTQDVPPYIKVDGHPVNPHGLNSLGLKRHHFSDEVITHLKNAYKILYRSVLPLDDAIQKMVDECGDSPEVKHFIDFIQDSKNSSHHRGICR